MNRRTMILTSAAAAVLFAGGAYFYDGRTEGPSLMPAASGEAPLVRPHAPVLGPADAQVTIVEFFDPACEACRAFWPVVKQIMGEFPNDVRLVLRYADFHPTSEQGIRILEAARLQGRFEPVVDRLLEEQPRWAPHGRPPANAWTLLNGTGLDVAQAQKDAGSPEINKVLAQDAEDVEAVGVRGTPTFFVNGKPLREFGAQQLYDLVRSEVEAQ